MTYSASTREQDPSEMPSESPQLLRELYRAYTEENAAIANYGYAEVLLEQHLPQAAELFSSISMTEMRHYETLARLLRDQGAPFALRTTIRSTPYRLLSDADSHAPVVAQQILKDRIRDEKNANLTYRGLAKRAVGERMRSTLLAISEDEGQHAKALEMALARLERS